MKLERRENDIYDADERVALIDVNGHLKMTKGNAERRDEVTAWLDEHEPDEEKKAEEPISPAKESTKGEVPPCPEEDPRLGDKTPEVVAWMFQYHPKEAAKRYEGRKVERP